MTAAAASGWTSVPIGEAVEKAMRSTPGSRLISSANGRCGGAIANGSPGSGPERTSSAAAVSLTLREMTPSTTAPNHISAAPGPSEVRPRDGLRPNRPQYAAGMRIEPPPSLAAATGTIPAATAAAAPPLDPPDVRSRLQGLLTRPNISESDTPLRPNSGRLVLPKMTNPDFEVAAHGIGVRLGDDRAHRTAAPGGRQAGVVVAEILEEQRHAGERSRERLREPLPRLLVHQAADRVDLRIDPRRLGERRVEQLPWARFAARHEFGEPDGVVPDVVRKPHPGGPRSS